MNLLFKKGASRRWLGNKAKYEAKHQWLSSNIGRIRKCSACKTKNSKKFEWANISEKYKRDLKDWIRLCCKCHKRWDRGQLILVIRGKKYERTNYLLSKNGVNFRKDRMSWCAQIMINKKSYWLGGFKSKREALRVRKKAALSMLPKYGVINIK